MKLVQIYIVTLVCLCAVAAFITEPYMTKYARRKMSDSCFSKRVMTAFRAQMHAAIEKCRGDDPIIQYELLAQFHAIVGIGGSRRKRSTSSSFSSKKLQDTRAKISEFIERFNCVLKELTFVDAENRVNLLSMKQRIAEMGLPKHLSEDLQEGADQCNDFANCLPESMVDKSPSTAKFGRLFYFFECFKRAKVESCKKQEFREDYLPVLQKENPAIDEDESFQTIIMSFMVGHVPF